NQMQFPLVVDFTKGHLEVVGGVASGKSTFLQTLFYSLVSCYSPAEINLYGIDFSSQMLTSFAGDAHVGGIVLEGEDDRLNKLFGLITKILQQRKAQIKGGSFSQYIRLRGWVMPAIVVAIDGYANFREKTENRFERQLIELSREAEGYGIFLVLSCTGFGGADLQNKIADNMRQGICLELADKYRYSEALHIAHFDVLPEVNVKGRGLAALDGNVLEYQTALACRAENDYARSEQLKEDCARMSASWTGRRATSIPEIPAKPVWELLSGLEEYRDAVKAGGLLPVAYHQEDASLYCVDLGKTFCYVVLGRERSGKSTFLRNLAYAARDTGGRLIMVDNESRTDARTAELVGAEYVVTPKELLQMLKDLTLLVNDRGAKRNALRQQDLEDAEIYRAMREEFPPLYVFLPDMPGFLRTIYSNLGGIGKLNANFEVIFAKGQLLNIYFFTALNVKQISEVSGYAAWRSFSKECNGVFIGGALNEQSLFGYQGIPFQEQRKRLKVGMAYAVDQADDQTMQPIVFPQNRGGVGG
ncbi:MAG: hypothetical protein LUG44_07835, partial [Clostridiales bacterium]|nr:hypothetical protein [Clostridiales bacterium]